MKVFLHLKMIHHFILLCKCSFKSHLKLMFSWEPIFALVSEDLVIEHDFTDQCELLASPKQRMNVYLNCEYIAIKFTICSKKSIIVVEHRLC